MNTFNTYVITLTMTTLLLAGCSSDENKSPEKPVVRPVKYMIASYQSGALETALSGRAQSAQESKLSFLVSGTLKTLNASVGDKLKKGQLIAELDSNTYQLQVQQAQASLEQALATAQNANSAYQRARKLYVNNSTSKNDLDASRANAESSKAQVRASQKSVELSRLDLKRTKLYSTGDCQVVKVNAEINENISSGNAVVDVSCGDGIEVLVSVPESIIDKIDSATETETRFSALKGSIFNGKVTEIGISSSSSITFPVTITLSGDTTHIRSGMAAQVTFKITNKEGQSNKIFLPASAVLEDASGTFVFLAEPTENDLATVKRQAITTGALTQNGLIIESGIEPEQRVITAGLSLIYDGLVVKLPR